MENTFHGAASRAPSYVRATNKLVTRLARFGVPMGPNALITIRGRKSGTPRTTPVAVVEIGGRRWVQSPFGEVNWVRNLRAVGEATLTTGKRQEHVHAAELSRDDAIVFFRDELGPFIGKSFVTRRIAGMLGLSDVLADPVGAAGRHPVFELTA